MKSIMISALLALALLPSFAEDYLENPIVVTMTSVKQESRSRDLVVNYTLENHPGIMRMDVLTNGVSIGAKHLVSFSGDYSMTEAMQPGAHTFRWHARRDWPANLTTNAVIRLNAYYTNQIDQVPGAYMRVDLAGGQSAESYPVLYTLTGPSTDDEGHANSTDDKDRYLWLRRVGSAGPITYRQGASTYGSLIDNAGTAEVVREVTLTNAFFVGVFPVTQAQYVRVIDKVGTRNGLDHAPVYDVSYDDIRGLTNAAGVVIDWPNTWHDKVGTNSFLHALRARTGLEFDLPTEAQWEFFCRAGTDTDFNDGSNLSPTNYYIGTTLVTNTQYSVSLAKIAWFGKRIKVGIGNAGSATEVGLKNPNAWELYDCHGNVWEWCLDKVQNVTNLTDLAVTDPPGPTSGKYRIMRGGAASQSAASCRSAQRLRNSATLRSSLVGFRLVCPSR